MRWVIYLAKRIPRSLLRGFHALAKPDPKGQNYVIPRLLAAGIGILRVLPVYFYVPEQVAERVRQEASAAGLSVSQYLAKVVKQELHPQWPTGFFEEVIGGWQGEPLQRAEQGAFDMRDSVRFGESGCICLIPMPAFAFSLTAHQPW